jgi:AraC-like DNA-binding protein
MPIYMDRHDVSENVTAEAVAKLHQEDLKIQHKFNCRGLTYWFDENRKTAFCLVEAPDEQSLIDMHDHAHGEVPHRIIEVDATIVESFLGRIEDPDKSQKTSLNIINDPAFRTIMVTGLNPVSLKTNTDSSLKDSLQKYNQFIIETIKRFSGRIVKQNNDYFMVSFESVSQAINCAMEVQRKFKIWVTELEHKNINLKIGLSAGIPVTEKDAIFEDTIKLAERMYYISKAKIIVSADVKDLYKSENLNVFIDGKLLQSLTSADEKFLNMLMDYTEKTWKNTNLQVDDIGKHKGYSKSQLYRKMISLTGKSPNTFIKEYRLNRALKLFNSKKGNVSEIAFETGFNSPSYFTKCFQKKFGLKPSDYLQAMQE